MRSHPLPCFISIRFHSTRSLSSPRLCLTPRRVSGMLACQHRSPPFSETPISPVVRSLVELARAGGRGLGESPPRSPATLPFDR